MRGAREVIRAETWRDPASLLTSRIRMELRRAGKKSSWGGGEGGEGSACVFGEADGFEVGHFGIGVRRGAGDGSFEEGNTVGGEWAVVFRQAAIGLKNNCGEICSATGG